MEVTKWEANNLCRTCVKELSSPYESMHIFETPGFANKLSSCISIEVSSNRKYSEYLCTCCSQKVNEFFEFREMCKRSIRRFDELRRCEKAWEFEDESPITVLNEQTSNVITVDEADFLEDNYWDNEESTKNVKWRKSRVKKGAKKNLQNHRGDERKAETREKADQNMSVPNERVATEATLASDDSFRNNLSLNAENNACQSGFTTKCNYETKAIPKQLTPHVSKVDKESKKYRCEICSSRFIVEHRFIAHKREHDGLTPYPCPREGCHKSFNRWNCLSRHLSQHEGQSFEYACEQNDCNKVYKHKPTLVMHQRKYHKLGPELKSHVCEICGKVFKTGTILNDHRYTHKDKSERPYACDQPNCMRRFANKEKLKVHRMRHAGIKKYKCPHCGMRKTTITELKVHINYHTLERTWPCRFCTHVCNSSGNLKTHVRTVHEHAKDYACRHCERSFGKPDTRKYHEMTHTGEKPNECLECGKRFLQPAALRTHRKIHQRQRARLETANNLVTNEMIAGHSKQKICVENFNTPIQMQLKNE